MTMTTLWPVLLAACAVAFGGCWKCGFVFDDVSAIRENRDLRPNTPIANVFLNDFWGTPMSKEQSHKSYRPICVLTFRLNYLLHGLDPAGYHVVNLALHMLCCVLFAKLCSRLGLMSSAAVSVAAVLFAVHPIHTEAVVGVVGRAELLSSIFYIAAILVFIRLAVAKHRSLTNRALLSLTFATSVALAVFSKEQGITVLGVCFVYDLLVVQRLDICALLRGDKWLRVGGRMAFAFRLTLLLATGVALLVVRFHVMGSTLPVFTNFDNPASYEQAPVKQLTMTYLVAVNSWLLLNPSDLCCDWTMGTVPLIRSLSDVRNAATVFTALIMAALGLTALATPRRRDASAMALALAMAALPFLPASNLFFPVGFVVAERVLYLPSMGYCILVALGFDRMRRQFKHRRLMSLLLRSSACFVLLLLTLKSMVRTGDWRDELSLFLSGLKVTTSNAKLFNNVGHALETEKRYSEALTYFRTAVLVQPDDIGAHINVGRTLNNLELFSEAEEAYRVAKAMLPQAKAGQKYTARIAPQHLSVFLNLANLVSRDRNRLEEADLLYRQAISMRADYIQAYINRGDILLKLNRSQEAKEVYEKALVIEPNNADLHYNLGVVCIEHGNPTEALAHFDAALAVDPEHAQALMNSAILIQETGLTDHRPVAYERLFKVLERSPDSDRAYFNLGMLAMDDGDLNAAEGWFRRAVDLKQDFRSALFNLALLLNDLRRPLEAVPFLKRLLEHHPDHIKAYVLLGDIYTNHAKDYAAAEACYKRIVALDPGHVQARHNLCVVMVEQDQLSEAERCLHEVLAMAPDLDYVARHLAIVENRIKLMAATPPTTTASHTAAR